MSYLYDVVKSFWLSWFGLAENLSQAQLDTIELIAMVSTIALVYAVIIKPILYAVGLPFRKR